MYLQLNNVQRVPNQNECHEFMPLSIPAHPGLHNHSGTFKDDSRHDARGETQRPQKWRFERV